MTAREQLVHQLQCQGAYTAQAARELVDAHTDQVLTEDGQAYPGELAMYRQLVRTLRVAARNAEWDAVQQALINHAADDGAAREKSTATSGDATPDFFRPGHAYTHRDDSTFRCIAVTTHPDGGAQVAVGWHTDTAGWTFIAVRDINHWNHEYDGVQPPAEGGVE